MQNFFKKNSNYKIEKKKYPFIPIKNDASDEATDALFGQLEEGAKFDTDIYSTIKEGANLYAKKTGDDFNNCYPIHIAAYHAGYNTGAINSILQTFDDPEKRKQYMYLKDDTNRNALEILIEDIEDDYPDFSLPSILSILSYLTAEEQQEIINSLSEKAKEKLEEEETEVTREDDIGDLAQLNYFLNQGNTIEMCRQRRKEQSKVLANYDSDEESLGQLESVYHKKFTARVSYKDILENGIVVDSIPELTLIPSDWRLETAMEGNQQGDHVIAYVLLLSSFSHCKGENIKALPELVYNLAVDVLPDYQAQFLQKKKKNDEMVKQFREIRVETVSSLKAECDKAETFLRAVENNLKKAEIESIARHIEENINHVIMILNQLQDESFSQRRKESITGNYVLQQLKLIIDKKITFLNEKKYLVFKTILLNAIESEAKKTMYQTTSGITDKTLTNIAKMILEDDCTDIEIPDQLLSQSGNLTQTALLDFLKTYTPLKKYHEGHAIKHIETHISKLKKITSPTLQKELLNQIGFCCFNLFDYPKVNDAELNNEYVLYQAIPRHMIIILSAFSGLKVLTSSEKKIIYEALLNHILMLQLWKGYPVVNNKNEIKPLNLTLLKKRILEFANLDVNHDFSMKPTSSQPKQVSVSDVQAKKTQPKMIIKRS